MSRLSQAVSFIAHALVIALLILPAVRPRPDEKPTATVPLLDPAPFQMHRPAGGGGARQDDPPTKGVIPQRRQAFTPPLIERAIYRPKPEVPMAIEAPPEMRVDPAAFVGDPNGLDGMLSAGSGGPAGIGTGSGHQIGGGSGEHSGSGIDGVFSAGQRGVTAPVPIRIVDPEYSDLARKAHFSGSVEVYAEIDPQGHPRNLRILKGIGLGLDEKALDAVSRWLFKPGMKDGHSVTVRATFEVNFRLL